MCVGGEWGARVLGRGVAIMEEELGESLGRCALLAADADDADEAEGSGFSDLEDDVLAFILSFLSPSDIAACIRVSRRLRKLCNDDHKVVFSVQVVRHCVFWQRLTSVCEWNPVFNLGFQN